MNKSTTLTTKQIKLPKQTEKISSTKHNFLCKEHGLCNQERTQLNRAIMARRTMK